MKQYLITGTDRGLGLALAERALMEGHRVFMACLDPEGTAVKALTKRFQGQAVPIALDLGDPRSIQALATTVSASCTHLDRLINNAGILGDIEHTLGDSALDPDAVLEVIRINTIGPLRLTQALWPLLLADGERLLINISSEAGSIGQNWRDRWFGYALSKAALNMETALIHRRLREGGGRALLIHPGYLRTYMHGAKNNRANYEPEEAASLIHSAIEARLAQPVGERPDFFDLHGKDLPW